MRKSILTTLCLIFAIILLLPLLGSCGADDIYELGPYSIDEEEYAYLLSTYKRQIIEGMGLDESYLNYQISDSSTLTYGQYIEQMYRSDFEKSVHTLLYAQALFDEYNLSLSDAEINSIERVANYIISVVGDGSTSVFDDRVEPYGFSADAIRSVYEMQAKESAVVNYLFGSNYSKLTESQKEEYFSENYIHFQVLVVNTLYFQSSDGKFINLSEEERAEQIQLENELIQLLIGPEDPNFQFRVLPAILGREDVRDATFEELWNNSLINDDMVYKGGWYMPKPNAYQLTQKTTLTQAMLTMENDVSAIAAKRYFEGNGSISTEGGKEQINKGDYFEYGTAFIKRLPMEKGAWKKDENKDFFGDSFIAGAAQSSLMSTLQRYSETSEYTLVEDSELRAEYSFLTIPANYVDYDYFHPKEEE